MADRNNTRGRQEGDGEHYNVDGSPDRRFQDNGQGDVINPDTDMRLKENRDNLSGNNRSSSNRSTNNNRDNNRTTSRRDSGQGDVRNPSTDGRLKENGGGNNNRGRSNNR